MEEKPKKANAENEQIQELSQEETDKVAGGDVYNVLGAWGDQQAHNIPDNSKDGNESESKSGSAVWGGYRDMLELLGAMGEEEAHNIPKFF